MFAARGEARGPFGSRVPRATLTLLFSSLILFGITAGSASASSISAKRAEARAVEAQISSAQVQLEKQIERYDYVHSRLVKSQHQLAESKIVLANAKDNLRASQIALAQSLTSSYKKGGQNVVEYLLAARSINDLVTQMQVLQRSNESDTQLIKTISVAKKTISKQEHALSVETANLSKEQAAQKHEEGRIRAGIASLQSREAGISADIKHLIAQQQAAANAAAARQAAAAATAAGGGGGGGSAGSGADTSLGNIPAPPSSTLGGQAVAIAEQYLGVPYVWGGASPAGFDCSGLVMYVYGQLGVSLPHFAAGQYSAGPHVPESDLQPGDLVFFYGLGHVGIYVGGGMFIHAPHTGTVVSFASLASYQSVYVGATRILG